MSGTAAFIYAGLTAVVIVFHMAMLAGAPWGHLTMGGRFRGRLKGVQRLLPLLQTIIVIAMAVPVLAAAKVVPVALPEWVIWISLTLSAIAVVGNAITPSASERRLWLPVTLVMLACVVTVIWLP